VNVGRQLRYYMSAGKYLKESMSVTTAVVSVTYLRNVEKGRGGQ
jgi:hypothetical protein